MCATGINVMEDLYSQKMEDLVSEEQFARNRETFRGLLSQPGFRAYWQEVRSRTETVSPRFTAFVDSLAAEDAGEYSGTVV
jgi:hypothetical protein